jgi:predicted metal-dependent peptidase
MILEDKLERAKTKLMLSHPFFGSLCTTLEFEKSDDIESFTTKNRKFIYNDEYLSSLSDDELTFVLANASMHQSMHHNSRKSNRMSWLWNLATDYTINSILLENGLTLPSKINYDKKFDGMYAEEIYEELRSTIDHKDQHEDEGESSQESKEQNQPKEQITQDESLDLEVSEFLEKLTLKLEKQGELPRGLDRVIDLKKRSYINWKDELYRYVNSHAKSDYRFFPPNMKYLHLGFALPSVYGEKLEIAVAVDTSASIDLDLLDQFLEELGEIMRAFDNYEILFIECDSKIQNVTRLTPQDELKSTLKGGGGTDFTPVFELLQDREPNIKFLIYFTDGMGKFPSIMSQIDTLWVMPEKVDIPFGEVILFSNKQ